MATLEPTAPQFSRLPRPGSSAFLSQRSSYGSTLLSALLLVGAFPRLDWGWLAWIALAPFLSTFPYTRLRTALAHGMVFGLVFFGGLAYWLAIFAGHAIGTGRGILCWLIATTAQAGFMAAFAGWAQVLRIRGGLWAWRLGVPALWTLLEWVRQSGLLGISWGDVGYSQHSALAILQVTRLTGVWGLSFLIVLVNVALSEYLKPASEAPGRRGFLFGTVFLVVASLIYGVVTLHQERLHPTFGAAALQPNINEDVLWDGRRPRDPAYVKGVMDTLAAQGRAAARQGAILTVAPETVFPGYPRLDEALRAQASTEAVRNNQAIFVGGRDYDMATNKDSNDLFLFTPTGQLAGAYLKRELVPFGEFVPYRKWLPFLEALHLSIFDMEPGANQQPLLAAGPPVGKVGAAICYESSYGRLTREQVARGAGLLVIITDDTWFGRTAAARQHAALAAVRAVESDRYVVRAAETGISQIIAPTGKVLCESDLFQPAVLVAPVEARTTVTPYVRWGDWFVAACALLLCTAILFHSKRNR